MISIMLALCVALLLVLGLIQDRRWRDEDEAANMTPDRSSTEGMGGRDA
jgi:hypothetical protein